MLPEKSKKRRALRKRGLLAMSRVTARSQRFYRIWPRGKPQWRRQRKKNLILCFLSSCKQMEIYIHIINVYSTLHPNAKIEKLHVKVVITLLIWNLQVYSIAVLNP